MTNTEPQRFANPRDAALIRAKAELENAINRLYDGEARNVLADAVTAVKRAQDIIESDGHDPRPGWHVCPVCTASPRCHCPSVAVGVA